MRELSLLSHSAKETVDFAKKLSGLLKKGDVIGFFGDLGSGKTTFIKGLAKGLGFNCTVNSPSFVVLKIYPKNIPLYHFDLYRLKSLRELEDMGYEDFITDTGICVIEWANRAKSLLPEHYLKIGLQIKSENSRKIKLVGYGQRYNSLISKMRPLRHSGNRGCGEKKALEEIFK